MSKMKPLVAAAVSSLACAISLGTATAASAASVASPGIVEHYDGQTFTLTPDNWNGATDCAFVTPTDAYCFNNDAAFESFTGVPRNADGQAAQGTPLGGASPDTSGTCNGWAKIWNGTNFTDTGLAFEDYGSAQYLGDYTQVPFKVVSWFTDGQRGYSAMTNCYGETLNSGGVDVLVLHTNAQADSMGPVSSYYIELFSGTD